MIRVMTTPVKRRLSGLLIHLVCLYNQVFLLLYLHEVVADTSVEEQYGVQVGQSYGVAAEKKYLQNIQHSILIESVHCLTVNLHTRFYVSTRGLHVYQLMAMRLHMQSSPQLMIKSRTFILAQTVSYGYLF